MEIAKDCTSGLLWMNTVTDTEGLILYELLLPDVKSSCIRIIVNCDFNSYIYNLSYIHKHKITDNRYSRLNVDLVCYAALMSFCFLY